MLCLVVVSAPVLYLLSLHRLSGWCCVVGCARAGVLSPAVGSSSSSSIRDAYIDSVLTRPCGFVPGKWGQTALFKPVSEIKSHKTGVQEFDAEVLQDFGGLRVGERVRITLNLFDPANYGLTVTSAALPRGMSFPAQLVLGIPVSGNQARDELMNSHLPAA